MNSASISTGMYHLKALDLGCLISYKLVKPARARDLALGKLKKMAEAWAAVSIVLCPPPRSCNQWANVARRYARVGQRVFLEPRGVAQVLTRPLYIKPHNPNRAKCTGQLAVTWGGALWP